MNPVMGTRLNGNPFVRFLKVKESHTCSITGKDIPEGMPCVFIENQYKHKKSISNTTIISAEGIRELMHALEKEKFEQSFITEPKRSTSTKKCPVCFKGLKRTSTSISIRGVTNGVSIHYECSSDLYDLLQDHNLHSV